jgi:hypothetical protein
MTKGIRILIYILLTALIEGCCWYAISVLSSNLMPTSPQYQERLYFYYISYNIGYLIYFPHGMEYGTVGSGFGALITGCFGMFAFIYIIGEAIVYGRERVMAKTKRKN